MKTDVTVRAKAITRRTKILTLVPGLIASGAATALVITMTGPTAATDLLANAPLPTLTVPTGVIQAPATVTAPTQVAPAVPNSDVEAVVATSYTSGIPAIALKAYRNAATLIGHSDPSCNMPWQLLAAIGRVESDHGQFGGSHLNAAGEDVPPIYGPELDGQNGMVLDKDTGNDPLDGDSPYVRAVGPMQFLPSTWRVVAADGNGDGKPDPQNIYDATYSAAIYLCSGRSDMNDPADVTSAIYRYNHSEPYVALVTAIMKAYEAGDYTAYPSIPQTASASAASSPTTAPPARAAAEPVNKSSASPSTPAASASASSSPTASASPSNAPMTSSQANNYCADHLGGSLSLSYLFEGSQCTKKLTGMTPSQADAGWAANQNNLPAWFNS